jgi:hypothetical protein
MNLFSRLFFNRRQHRYPQKQDKGHTGGDFFSHSVAGEENFSVGFPEHPRSGDGYLYNAWVHIAVNILIRNIARADFVIKKGGEEAGGGPVYGLFKRPHARLSRYDLWKETAAWWYLEGEAFWWFGPDYAGGGAAGTVRS